MHIIIYASILHWLFTVGRESYIQEHDRETNMACAVSRLHIEHLLNLP